MYGVILRLKSVQLILDVSVMDLLVNIIGSVWIAQYIMIVIEEIFPIRRGSEDPVDR